jgi:hypothetical protein
LVEGRSALGEYGIDKYGSFANRPGDRLQGHEVLENLWLEVHGFGGRGESATSRNNPAVALSESEHTEVGRQQRTLGLFDRGKLAHMSAEQVIELNATAMRRAGIPHDVIETIKKQALDYAKTLTQ